MLNLFRTNQLTNAFLFILYIAALRGATFFFPELRLTQEATGGYFTELAADWISGFWINEIFLIILLSLQAFFLSYLVSEHRLSKEVSLFTGVFFLLISASSSWFFPISGTLLANTFLIFALWAMLNTYRIPNCADTIFNIGFWIAVATLFEMSYFVFLIWAIFGLNFMRALKFKEILTVIVGFLTPYFLLLVYYFWIDKYDFFIVEHFHKNFGLSRFAFYENIWLNISVGFLLFLVAVTVFNSGNYFKKKNIQVQKRISVIFLMMLVSLATVFFQPGLGPASILVLVIPLSVFIGFTFINMRRQTASSIHLVWFVATIVLLLRPLFFGG